MATPYLELRRDSVPSTQDVAREFLEDQPVLVIAAHQTAGRGRAGTSWMTAPRALATSLGFRAWTDIGPLSLTSGVAARRVLGEKVTLKWPNDLLVGEGKVGGILVETSGDAVVVGMGLNIWWPDPPEGIAALGPVDPGPEEGPRIARAWAEAMLDLVGRPWPIAEYREGCSTLGREVTWEPGGSGVAVDVAEDGTLVVESAAGVTRLVAGTVTHVR